MPPAGYKRSRALWDEARRPRPGKKEHFLLWVRAIVYELQPIRFSAVQQQHRQALQGLRTTFALLRQCVVSLPFVAQSVWQFLQSRSREQWMVVAAVLVYYLFLRWIHEVLDAGPIVLILTTLAAIFSIGLGDNANPDGLSAYSVFNRGFERLLGSVDADALLAQHVGGGWGGGGLGMAMARENENPVPAAQRPRQENRRNPPLNNDPPADDNIENARDDGDGNNNANNGENNTNNNNRSRKSGKKARRRNLEQRREIRRQLDAAMELGLDGGEGHREQMAMQRLLEEQIAAEREE